MTTTVDIDNWKTGQVKKFVAIAEAAKRKGTYGKHPYTRSVIAARREAERELESQGHDPQAASRLVWEAVDAAAAQHRGAK
jgi:hypothetical protein